MERVGVDLSMGVEYSNNNDVHLSGMKNVGHDTSLTEASYWCGGGERKRFLLTVLYFCFSSARSSVG